MTLRMKDSFLAKLVGYVQGYGVAIVKNEFDTLLTSWLVAPIGIYSGMFGLFYSLVWATGRVIWGFFVGITQPNHHSSHSQPWWVGWERKE